MTLQDVRVSGRVKGLLTAAFDLTTGSAPHDIERGSNFQNGTGAGLVDLLFSDTRNLGASGSEDLDLAGALAGVFGNTVFARVRGLLVYADPTNVNNVVVGANVANGWSGLIGPNGASGGTITLRPGSFFVAGCGEADATGFVVTAASNDLLHVANSAGGTSVSYQIAIVGCSA